jgi:hypothetical protein
MEETTTITLDEAGLKNLKKISKRFRDTASIDSAEATAEDGRAALEKLVQILNIDVRVAKKLTRYMSYAQMVELSEMDLEGLEEKATSCCIDMKRVKEETEANEAYQEAKETVKTFSAKVRETCAPTKNTLDVCILLAEQKRRTDQED